MRGGPSPSPDEARATLSSNFSFVLHEPSWSPKVSALVEQQLAAAPSDMSTRLPSDGIIGSDQLEAAKPQVILTARLGVPPALQALAARLRQPAAIMTIDGTERMPGTPKPFFRAPARLRLPALPVDRLVVAAAFVRPGGRQLEVVCSKPYAWPGSETDVLVALEALIRAHVDQWRPGRALWDAPAEELLPEVLTTLPTNAR